MKLSWLLLASSLTAASPVPYVNNKPTIWSQDAVVSMKESIDLLYKTNLDLYNRRHMFDGAPNCSVGTPVRYPSNFSHTAPTACSIADHFIAEANTLTLSRFRDLAQAMFPVSFNLTDNNSTPRASFSDFSHFYNHFLIQASTFMHISEWYECRGNLGYSGEGFWSFYHWYDYPEVSGLGAINYGPFLYENISTGQSVTGMNGTLNKYGTEKHPSKFIDSFYPNWKKWNNALFFGFEFFGAGADNLHCVEIIKRGVPKPVRL